jgi:uncharacterized membrane protein
MDVRKSAACVLGVALGAVFAAPVLAADSMSSGMEKVVHDNMVRAQKNHLEHCYGINAAGKNDCATGVHSCAGEATQARDPQSFVLLPAGDCTKIQGGSTKAA